MLCACGCGQAVTINPRAKIKAQWMPTHRPGVRRSKEKRCSIERICEHCKTAFKTTPEQISRGWGRFCRHRCMYDWRKAQPRKGRPHVIRQLEPGEPLPTSEPRRYKSNQGYIRLRWKVGTKTYVEAYEHRVIAGVVTDEVHHLNHDRADNEPSNLKPITRSEHARLHGVERQRFDLTEAVALYVAGIGVRRIGIQLGVHPVTVLRRLKRFGVTIRPKQRNDLLHHESVK